MPTRPPREPFNALVLAALAVVVTAVLIAAGGRSNSVITQGEPSWLGHTGARGPRRQRRGSGDERRGTEVDGDRSLVAEAARGPPAHPGRRRPTRVQLHAYRQRLLGRVRRARHRAA